MKFFRSWFRRIDTESLERAKRAEAEADQKLRESQATAQWARRTLERTGPDELTKLFLKTLGGHS